MSQAATPSVISIRPVTIPAPARGDDLEVRVSAPADGYDLPVVVFSHGFGWSMDGYAPLTNFWAAHGFVVIQPTHLDSSNLGLAPDDPRTPRIWRHRVDDLTRVLDELDRLEAAVPGLDGRMNRDHIAASGHSWGATTASALLGARVINPDGSVGEDLSDPRVTAGVLLALAGTGGADLTPFAAEQFPFMNPSFAELTTPALVVAGDHDQSLLSFRGPDWWTDAYQQSPGADALLTLFGAEHSLGGIVTTLAAKEMSDAESPELLALVQRVTTAYLRRGLGAGDDDWTRVKAQLGSDGQPLGRLENR